MNEVSINFGGLIGVSTLTFWGIVLLYIHYKHKKRIKKIQEDLLWSESRRRRRQQDRIDRQWNEVNGMWLDGMTMEEGSNWYWQRGRRPAIIPYDEIRPKTDKLSPKKKKITHKMDMT